jgi:hypothetical protein
MTAIPTTRTGHTDPNDPKGLIHEAYQIDGISDGECRSILIDWALSLAPEDDPHAALGVLHARHAPTHADHPMTLLLQEGLTRAVRPCAATARNRGRRPRTGPAADA